MPVLPLKVTTVSVSVLVARKATRASVESEAEARSEPPAEKTWRLGLTKVLPEASESCSRTWSPALTGSS